MQREDGRGRIADFLSCSWCRILRVLRGSFASLCSSLCVSVPLWFTLLAVGLAPLRISAAEPIVRNLNVRGLQIGGSTSIVLDGDGFGTAPRLLLPFPVKAELKKGATDKQATFDVTLGGDVVPGYYHLRVVTDAGICAPIAIAVDKLPQRLLTAVADPLPAALHGAFTGSTVAETKFAGKAGQKVLVEIEAQRLGSKLRPIVHLYSPKRVQLAWAWTTTALHGDARVEATLPEDGVYIVTVHDVEYAGAAPGFFRLRIGEWSSADRVFPPVVAKGQMGSVELLGPASPRAVNLPIPVGGDVLPLVWPKDGMWSGPRPFVMVSPHAEVVGQTTANKPQLLPAVPIGVSGRVLTPFGEDRYRVPVMAGSKLRLAVFAERYGSPLDAALVVRNEKGDLLVRVEDSPGTLDPVLEYAVPAGVKEIVVGVVDAQGRGGSRAIYRLTVEGVGGASDFRLLSPAQAVSLPIGGRWVVPVLIDRRGYPGDVAISSTGLPAGVTLDGATIPVGADGALVTLQRTNAAAVSAITQWVGRTAGGVERPVLVKGSPMERIQPWLATEIAVAPTTVKAADFQIDWRGLPPDAGPVPAKKLVLPVKVVRPAKDSVVRLTLLTSQSRPILNGVLDPAKALKLEKPAEIGPKTNDGEVTVLAPPLLDCPVYDVTVQAELLTPDKKTVLAIAFAPVRRMIVRVPLVVKLAGPARIEAAVNPKTGGTVKIAGQVERKEGLVSDVTLTLLGLPPGASAAPAIVKMGTTAFAFNVVLPANQAVGEIKGLKIAASAPADPKTPAVVVRGREVELTLAIVAAKAK
jgi:hypothetical protein